MNFVPVHPQPPRRPGKYAVWAIITLLLFWIIAMLSSCQTAKQLIDKAEAKDPAAVAAYTRDKYPCTDLLKNDTAVIFRDSVVYIDCPDTTGDAAALYMPPDIHDTVRLAGRTIRVPVHLPIQVQYITRWYEDSSKLKLLALEVQGLRQDTAAVLKDNRHLQGKLHTRNKEALWLLILVILLTLWTFRKVLKLLV